MEEEHHSRQNSKNTHFEFVTPTSSLVKMKNSDRNLTDFKHRDETALKCGQAGILFYEEATKKLRDQHSHEHKYIDVQTKFYEEMNSNKN